MIYIKKWFFLAIAIVVLHSCKSVQSTTTINANAQKVWNVLLDTERYPEWNPVMTLLNGDIKEGNKVKYRVTEFNNKKTDISAKVLKVVPNSLLNQRGGVPLIITFNHKYKLIPKGDKTEVIIFEKYTGAYVPFWSAKNIKKTYVELNQALKKRVENLTTIQNP